ncbi:MAG: hypothetical protein ACHQZR_06635 [Candidatus Limnocylindrales bacterium]
MAADPPAPDDQTRSDPTSLLAMTDDELIAALARALGETRTADGLALPDPRQLVADARRLIAYWDAELYGACCTDEAAYAGLRGDLGDLARVADALLVDALTDALATASRLPRSVTRLIAAFVVKHGFDTGHGLACSTWAGFIGSDAAGRTLIP